MRREVEDLPDPVEEEAVDLRVVPPFPVESRQPEPDEARSQRLETPADRVAARRRLDRLAERWW